MDPNQSPSFVNLLTGGNGIYPTAQISHWTPHLIGHITHKTLHNTPPNNLTHHRNTPHSTHHPKTSHNTHHLKTLHNIHHPKIQLICMGHLPYIIRDNLPLLAHQGLLPKKVKKRWQLMRGWLRGKVDRWGGSSVGWVVD